MDPTGSNTELGGTMRVYVLAILISLIHGRVDASPPFRVSIVPTSSEATDRSITTAPHNPDRFYVVLTNVSAKPQPVFETWNSWGYRSITFELVLNGKKHLITKEEQSFSRNFPSTFEIPPGEAIVYPIQLDSSWEGLPVLKDDHCCPTTEVGGAVRIQLTAVYEVESSVDAAKQKVWVGRIRSPTHELTLRWWR
jgi:hypothetical protein